MAPKPVCAKTFVGCMLESLIAFDQIGRSPIVRTSVFTYSESDCDPRFFKGCCHSLVSGGFRYSTISREGFISCSKSLQNVSTPNYKAQPPINKTRRWFTRFSQATAIGPAYSMG